MLFGDFEKSCNERHLHPSIYEKVEVTKTLLETGVDKAEFKSNGGLDYDTYFALQRRWKDYEQIMSDKRDVSNTYRSLNVQNSSFPCQEHEPVTGTKNALVLLAEFNDKKHSHEPDEFYNLLFSKNSKLSMRNYYLEASWNQLDIQGDVHGGWHSLTGNREDYTDDPFNLHYPNAQKMVIEIIIDEKTNGKLDFTPYAKDGEIELLIIVYAGSGMDTKLDKNFIRPHQYHLQEPIEVQDGIFVKNYCLVPELPIDDLGCFCHEVGHILGLPDLYMEGYSPVVGGWCLMGIGDQINKGKTPSHPSAWCKLHLGWTRPVLVTNIPQLYDIPGVIDEKTIYKVEVQGSNGKEYFLLENRQQKGFDENLPSSGLLIWHVNENACVKQAPNFDPNHFFLTLKQSDGKMDLEKDRSELIKQANLTDEPPKDVMGDSGDPFPGITINKIFNNSSNPNSRSYNGNDSYVEVESISDSNEIMKAQIGIKSMKSDTFNIHVKSEVNLNTEDQLKQEWINTLIVQNFLTSRTEKNSYDAGIEDGKKECLREIVETECLNFYQRGYSKGYSQGYDEAKRFFLNHLFD